MIADCIIPDGPTAFSAVEAPDGFHEWVKSILSTVTYDLDSLGVTYQANSRTGYHASSRQVWLEPRLMDTTYGARVIPHEYGHAVDYVLLARGDRAELMDAWEVPGSRNLTTWRSILDPHDLRPREAFASYFGRIVSPHAFPWSVNDWYSEAGMEATERVIRRVAPVERQEEEPAEPPTFLDIEGHAHRTSIERMAAKGVIHGFPDGTFRPEQPVTRAQVAVMLDRLTDLLRP